MRTPTWPAVLTALLSLPAWAQTTPDAGVLMRQQNQAPATVPALPDAAAPAPAADSGQRVTVQRFVVEGSSRFAASTLEAVLAPYAGQALSLTQLQFAADQITRHYREAGLHAVAILPPQTIADGVVRIVVVEGRLGRLRVEGELPADRPLPLALARDMLLEGQQPGALLDTEALERGTLLANELPGLKVSAVLAAGTEPGTTDIVAQVAPRPLWASVVSADNHDPRATGPFKISASAAAASPTGHGDEGQLAAALSQGKRYLRLGYGLPLGASGLRANAAGSAMRYHLVGDFAASGAAGEAATLSAALSYPVLRSPTKNLTASVQVQGQQLRNTVGGVELSNKVDRALTLHLHGDRLDDEGGGGAWVGSLDWTLGRLDLSGNAADLLQDQVGPRRHGGYGQLAASLGRLQRVGERSQLWLAANGQLAGRNLDSGRQFSLGGPSGVRAYPTLEASGDAGLLFTAEWRQRLEGTLQGALFYDGGVVQRQHHPQPGSARNRVALHGVGAGLEWQPTPGATLRAVVATRLGRNPLASANGSDSDGTRRTPQLWLSASLPF